MTLLYYDRRFVEHDPGQHPESPARIQSIGRMLDASGLLSDATHVGVQQVADEDILRIHGPKHLAHLKQVSADGGGRLDADTVMGKKSLDVATLAAGCAVDAVTRVLAGEDKTALCLTRPPGHHAIPDSAMGFCLLSNVAIAAQTAIDRLGIDRVLVVDWDVHHGNGTQDAFYANEQVTFFSAHRFPFYPGSGSKAETGTGEGLGATFNLPLKYGISRSDYHVAFENMLTQAADRCRPQLVLISAGFDAHEEDPVGDLGLQTDDFKPLTELVQQVADTHANGRLVSILEGGYNVERLAESVELHLRTLLAPQ